MSLLFLSWFHLRVNIVLNEDSCIILLPEEINVFPQFLRHFFPAISRSFSKKKCFRQNSQSKEARNFVAHFLVALQQFFFWGGGGVKVLKKKNSKKT